MMASRLSLLFFLALTTTLTGQSHMMASRLSLLFILALTTTLTGQCWSVRILATPTTIGSHMRHHILLGLELIKQGHEVTVAWPSHVAYPEMARGTKLEVLVYQVNLPEAYMNSKQHTHSIIDYAMTKSSSERFSKSFEMLKNEMAAMETECDMMFEDKKFMATIKSRTFDIALADAAGICFYLLPYTLDIPYISISIPVAPAAMYRVPALPSFYPSVLLAYTDQMSFSERMSNLIMELSFAAFANDTGIDYYHHKHVSHKPYLGSYGLYHNSAMFFWTTDPSVQYSFPLPPNSLYLGDLLCRSPEKLPTDLLAFVEGSKAGVMIVSFGSLLDSVPQEVTEKLCTAFRHIKQNVIWKTKYPERCQLPGKLLSLSWIPQNDLLAHPNVKLFLTHGGVSSFFETLYHATPVIACPLFLDQLHAASLYEAKHYGKQISIADFTPEELVDKVKFVISDPTIREQLDLASRLLRSKPETAGQRASYWINHIVTHGHKHLRSSAYNLNLIEFYMIDLLFILFIILLGVLLISIILICCICKALKWFCVGKNGKLKKN